MPLHVHSLGRRLSVVSFFLACTAIPVGCGGDDDAGGGAAPPIDLDAASEAEPDAADAAPWTPQSVHIEFERVADSNAFDVVVLVSADTHSGGEPVYSTMWPVEIESDRGAVGDVQATDENGTPAFRARVSPDRTGRHRVTASIVDTTLTAERTALVLSSVGEQWNQPEPVQGLVNTAGWEDGADISGDGQWLIVQYLPVPIDCMLGMDQTAPACAKAIGPVGAPERPGMPGANRVAADGTITHGCPSLGIPSLPIPLPPNTLYAFRRGADDSSGVRFEAPHPVYWDGADGCVSSFGPALIDLQGTDANLLYAFDTPTDQGPDETGGDLFGAPVKLGADIVLGRLVSAGGVMSLADEIGTPIGHPTEGHEGNPHPWRRPGGGYTVFYDDEADRQDLLVTETDGALDSGSWSQSVRIPEPVSVAGKQESQPFFDGTTLYFRRDLAILASTWNGGPWGEATSWSDPEVVLGENPAAVEAGEVLGEGEPTVAVTATRSELYFVFVERAEDGTLNLDIGVVPSRETIAE